MTQTTLALIESHEDGLEVDDDRNYQRIPRPFRRRERPKKRRRTAALTTNGRNSARSTFKSFNWSRRAAILRAADVS